MKHLLEYLIIHLVNHPEEVSIEEEAGDYRTTYRVYAHEDDIGRIIGQGGKTIKAIRKVARVYAAKNDLRFRIDIAG